MLRDAKGPLVRIEALRYLRGAGFEKLQRALAGQDGKAPVAPPSPSVTSLAKYSFSVVSVYLQLYHLLRGAKDPLVRTEVLRYFRGAGFVTSDISLAKYSFNMMSIFSYQRQL